MLQTAEKQPRTLLQNAHSARYNTCGPHLSLIKQLQYTLPNTKECILKTTDTIWTLSVEKQLLRILLENAHPARYDTCGPHLSLTKQLTYTFSDTEECILKIADAVLMLSTDQGQLRTLLKNVHSTISKIYGAEVYCTCYIRYYFLHISMYFEYCIASFCNEGGTTLPPQSARRYASFEIQHLWSA